MAPVGQEIMHQPQLTQLLSPIGLLLSKEMLVRFPLPIRPMTSFWATSVQARTHRSHRMQALWSIAMVGLVKSRPLGVRPRRERRDEQRGGRRRPAGRPPCGTWAAAAGRRDPRRAGLSRPRRSPSSSNSQSWVSW